VRTISAPALMEFSAAILRAVGVPDDDARLVATSLVGANLRGHDSHGVMRVPQYAGFIQRGEYRTNVALKVEQETPALVVCDGQHGLGQVQAHRLLDLIVPKARALGIAAAAARDCGHIGRLGEYAERAAASRLILLATVNNNGAGQRVAPPGGLEPRLGTNPFCAAVPTADPAAPVLVDFGTSVVAEGKVRTYYISKRSVPQGWLLDHQGHPTTDPAVLYEPPLGTILPVGAAQSYKGFGLGLILELLAGGLSGGRCSEPEAPPARGNNVVFIAIDPALFAGCDSLVGKATRLTKFIKGTPSVDGVSEILVPGDPERLALAQRTVTGIPLDDSHWEKLIEVARTMGVTVPE
jgi:hydroxycarboxylate dehydrogenase B